MSLSETMTAVIPTRSVSLQPLVTPPAKRTEPRLGHYVLGQTLGEGPSFSLGIERNANNAQASLAR
jgi:hypothetical protein